MKIDTLAHVKNQLSRVVDALGGEPLFITRNGRVVAVMQAISSDEIEDYMLRNSKRFWSLIDSRRRQAERGEVIPFDAEYYDSDRPAAAEAAVASEKRGRYKRKRSLHAKGRALKALLDEKKRERELSRHDERGQLR